MSYDAHVYNVIIASPSDVGEERTLIREAIIAWNYIHSEREKIVLLPVGWETHSAPVLEGRPQAILNGQILHNADLLVGIFGSRIGSPTGEAISGTVEEIETHRLLFKPAMVYFSERRGGTDPDQIAQVAAYEETCKTLGLRWTYKTPQDLREQFEKHLQIIVIKHRIFRKDKVETSLPIIENVAVPLDGRIPILMDEAKTLLIEASHDVNNVITKICSPTETIIRTNDKEFKDGQWPDALQQLCQVNCLRVIGSDQNQFGFTDLGNQTLIALAKAY
ncbi:MAG: DUF4062 domain-containing protein [Candidatus Omnitrophota bacterium]